VKMAIATSMATILFTSLSSVRVHHPAGAVACTWPPRCRRHRARRPGRRRRRFAVLQGQGLALFFALFIGWSALRMLRDRKPRPRPATARTAPRPDRRGACHRLCVPACWVPGGRFPVVPS